MSAVPWTAAIPVAVAGLSRSERYGAFSRGEAVAPASEVVTGRLPQPRPRHATHLVHGLGLAFRTARDGTRSSAS